MKYLDQKCYERLKEGFTRRIVDEIITNGFAGLGTLVGSIIQTVTIELERKNKKKEGK